MSTVILDGFEKKTVIENALKEILKEKGEEITFFKLKYMKILPCRSCGACGFKTPGKCLLDDDMHKIMKAIASSSILVMVTPIRFGGYSSSLKKAVDRMMVMATPFYLVKNGHLLHPMRYGKKTLIVIGVIEENLQDQEKNFKLLVERNALNMQFDHRIFIFKATNHTINVKNEIGKVLEGMSVS